MRHIFFIDPMDKLNIKKDSTLMMALSFKQMGEECYFLFEEDFYIRNDQKATLKVYPFDGAFKKEGFYLENLELKTSIDIDVLETDFIHMRIDPPYDTRYQRYLWMLDFLKQQTGAKVLNDPIGIMKNNEKLIAYKNCDIGHQSYVGSSLSGFNLFCTNLRNNGYQSIILKPLDLYSGIGVEKVELSDEKIEFKFTSKSKEFDGAIVCQPFIEDVYDGEYRSLYFDGVEIGTILKKPNEGEFLANIAQGAKFEKVQLPNKLKGMCDEMALELKEQGVRLVAYDLLGGRINEVNVTCPGLIVEVSYAYNENLCTRILNAIKL